MSLIDPDTTQKGQPAWRLALLYPPQGSWTEEDYFALDAGRLVEFEQGCIEVLDSPSKEHQRLVQLIYRILFAHVAESLRDSAELTLPLGGSKKQALLQPVFSGRVRAPQRRANSESVAESLRDSVSHEPLGEVFVAPLPVRLWNEKFREPDVLFVSSERGEYKGYPDGADLVVEVVSEDANSRRRDTVDKVREYAAAHIPEYWIVDLPTRTILIGILSGDGYRFTTYHSSQHAQSQLFPKLQIAVSELFQM